MRNIKKTLTNLWMITLIFALSACSAGAAASVEIISTSQAVTGAAQSSGAEVTSAQNSVIPANTPSVEYDQDDLDASLDDSEITYVQLAEDGTTFEGSGVTLSDNIVTITSAGTYSLSGILTEGQIVIDTADEETVRLILNGMDITNSTTAPIYIRNAEKAVLTLAEDTENYVTDGEAYIIEDETTDEPDAAIFSKDDLTINGTGSLTVNANYNNGITSKDDLKITGGNLSVNSVNDGIKGRDSIAVLNGSLTVNAGGDGLQANNDEDLEKGTINIEGGTITITAGMDGVQAETSLLISDGSLNITSGGGSGNSSSGENWGQWGGGQITPAENETGDSAKGLKAGVDIIVSGGAIQIDSSDDSIHSNDSLTISGGVIQMASGDDGIHADSTLEISGGEITITQSYEGIEGATITINEGNIHLNASDDGINAAGGNDGSSVNGRPGQNDFALSGNYHLYINGGYLFINASGDGIDSNGPIDITAGVVLVNGPTNDGNGPLDYTGAFNITGGYFVAVGSSGMAQAPSASSTQYSVMHNFASPQAAGTLIHIQSEDGEEILTFEPAKTYQSIVFSSPALENGSTYRIYSGGSSTGANKEGLYTDGAYTPGAQITSFTITSIVTGGAGMGGFPAGPGGNNRPQRP